jgi:hypothetical protein
MTGMHGGKRTKKGIKKGKANAPLERDELYAAFFVLIPS